MPSTHNGAREEEFILEEQLKQCAEEIERLEQLLTKQRAHRVQLEDQLSAHHASIAPIKRISEDILILIFLEVIVQPPNTVQPNMAIGDLLLVCRAWYRLVTTQPTLWNRIGSCLTGGPQEIQCMTQYLKSALRYSATSPLKITLDLSDIRSEHYWRCLISDIIGPKINWREEFEMGSLLWRFSQWNDAHGRECGFPPMLDYLSSVGEYLNLLAGPNGEEMLRWTSLSLTSVWGATQEQEWNSIKFLRHPMPLLEHLSIDIEWDPSIWPSLLIGDTPRLTTFEMTGNIPNIPMTCTAQVITLTLTASGVQDLVYLTRFINIRTLRIYCDGDTAGWLGFNEPLHFPQLRCMTIRNDPHLFLLGRLDAPLLHTLCLCDSSVQSLGLERSQVFPLPGLRFLLLEDVTEVPLEYKVTSRFSRVPSLGLLHGQRDILREQVRTWRSGGFPDIRGYVHPGNWDLSDLEEVVVD